MIRVLVVDDHAVVREGLKRILAEAGDILVVGEAINDQEALTFLAKHVCDVVVTDITMPGRGGLELLNDLKRERPKLPALVLSVHGEDQLAIRALKAGAAGYLTKESAPGELIKAIRKVTRGGTYVSTAVADRLARRLSAREAETPQDKLSDREFQVLKLMAQGRTVKEVGAELSLSVKTISTYRTRLLRKMSLKSSAALITYAIRNRLVD